MKGSDIRELLRKSNMKQWEVAERLNVSESTLIRWLRGEVSPDKEKQIKQIIADYGKGANG